MTPTALLFGRWVAERREALRLSQERLAEQLQVDQAAVSRLEAGRRRVTLDEFVRILDVLGVHDSDACELLTTLRRASDSPGLWIEDPD